SSTSPTTASAAAPGAWLCSAPGSNRYSSSRIGRRKRTGTTGLSADWVRRSPGVRAKPVLSAVEGHSPRVHAVLLTVSFFAALFSTAAAFMRLSLRTGRALRLTFRRGLALHTRRILRVEFRCRRALRTRHVLRVTFWGGLALDLRRRPGGTLGCGRALHPR